MSVKPILFNTEMVKAILEGRKTCTRRIVKPQPKSKLCYTFAGGSCGTWGYPSPSDHEIWGKEYRLPNDITKEDLVKRWKPPYHTDDILYVRETWNTYCKGCLSKNMESILGSTCNHSCGENGNGYYYKATDDHNVKWHPSIHMPKEAARIWLKVTDVRVERLQEITPQGAWKEGARCSCLHPVPDCAGNKTTFVDIWDSTIKKADLDCYGWQANPYVWVIEFERCDKPESEE